MVPFVRNELTAAVNPIKLLEYLSAGLPVVATALPEVMRMLPREGLAAAHTREEFIGAVERTLLAERSAAERQALSLAHRGDSWAGRCVTMMEHVQGAITPA
jgi:hypothetical protein